MRRTCSLLTLVLLLCLKEAQLRECKVGYEPSGKDCTDINECNDPDYSGSCGQHAKCVNTEGGFLCHCEDGFDPPRHTGNFKAGSKTCTDINECNDKEICGPNMRCENVIPYYNCYCKPGFYSPTGKDKFQKNDNVTCKDIDECVDKNICGTNGVCNNTEGSHLCICEKGFGVSEKTKKCEDMCVIKNINCGNGTCHHGADDYYCACHSGFSNYGGVQSRCIEMNCEGFKDMALLKENFEPAYKLMVQMTDQCNEMAESETSTKVDGEDMFKRLLSVIDQLLSGKPFRDNRKVSTFLDTVEFLLKLTGPFNKAPGLNKSSDYTELQLHLHKGSLFPNGNVTLSLQHAALDIQMETVAGEPSEYPDFAAVSLLSYKNLEESAEGFFDGVKKQDGEKFKINSKIISVTVTNPETSVLKEPIHITFNHKQQLQNTSQCVFWDSSLNGGAWSSRGCTVKESNPKYTVCACNHLSSFAVLMALYEVEDEFELQLITWVGLSLSLVCLFICILTFGLIRSIQSQRTKIHLHLSISLFSAFFIFLIGISRTETKVGCAVVAGLLHFFFLASFCWMCLEGIQLFRMVVLVFNSSFRTLYLMAAGYGVPAVIVSISAFTNANGYGTEKYCWLSLDSIWSFFGPACIIIFVNIIFFLITVWKLAQKFSSLNPDLDNLQKIRTFTVTAVAQLCVLGTMWIFGCFQFEENTIVMTYLFSIFASLQGVLIFILHCLCSKQVRDEYKSILSRCCAPQKKMHSELGYTNSSKTQQGSKSQDTGESHM